MWVRCDHCKNEFHIDDAGRRFEVLDDDGNGVYARVCPKCKHEEFVELEECERCHELVDHTTSGFCEKCYDEVIEDFSRVTMKYTDVEKQFLYEEFEWENWY